MRTSLATLLCTMVILTACGETSFPHLVPPAGRRRVAQRVQYPHPPTVLRLLREHAGAAARDCGCERRSSAARVNACIVKSFRAGKPFIATILHDGIDSEVATGVASKSGGAVLLVDWDSMGAFVRAQLCEDPEVTPFVVSTPEGESTNAAMNWVESHGPEYLRCRTPGSFLH